MEKKSQNNKTIKIKDIMRLFFKYEVDALSVLDNKKNFIGLIYKNTLIQDATESGFIEKTFLKFLNKYLAFPTEESFLSYVSTLTDDYTFPVVNKKGEFLFLWDKKQLLNCYYNITSGKKSESKIENLFFRGVLDVLPYSIIIINSKYEIVHANESFIRDFDFDLHILVGQKLSKFFTEINLQMTKSNFFPNIFNLNYRHIKWHYSVMKYKRHYIYIFSSHKERLTANNNDFPPITVRREAEPVDRKQEIVEKIKKDDDSLPDMMKNQEVEIIKKVLKDLDWNITKAAKVLNIPRQTLQYKISKYKILL